MSDADADVLLVTATKVESKAVLEAFAPGAKPAGRSIDARIYFDLGTVNGARVWMTQSEMGSGGLGASQQAVAKGIESLSPVAVVMVGIAFGVNEDKQHIGDVLVTEQLRLYDLQRVSTDEGQPKIILRGDKPRASPWLINHMKSAELTWDGATLRFGTIMTGEKLIDNIDFREQLRGFESETIGGEMEGAGLYVTCHDKKVDWILIKAVCDWADGNKGQDKDKRQTFAAKNAAMFARHALEFARVDWSAQRQTASNPLRALVLPAPAVDAPRVCHSSLPHQPLFFGRDKELAIVADAIAPQARTWGALIDGPGGIGKTALAVRAGHLAPVADFDRKIFLSAKVRELTATGEQKLEDYMLPNFLALLTEMAHELGIKDLACLAENERVNAVRRSLANARALLVIDNLETFPAPERVRLGQFLSRLPHGCKAIVTSRRRTDVDARILRLDRLVQADAMALLDALAETNPRLAAAGPPDRQRLYEVTGGNPLLLRWTVAQLGRVGSRCRTVDEAWTFLERAPSGNDPLEYIFGDLLDTFTDSEVAVLAALSHFSLPAHISWIAEVAKLSVRNAQTALEDLADRALLVGDAQEQAFVLPQLATSYLRRKRPEAVSMTGDRLVRHALTLARENGHERYDRFPSLEKAWPGIFAAIQCASAPLCLMYPPLMTFLDFSGRWDERVWLAQKAEEEALAADDSTHAGWCAFAAGYTHFRRGQALEVLASASQAAMHWCEAGAEEQATAIRLRGKGRQLEKNYPAAIDDYLQALTLHRSIDPESASVAVILNDIGNVERLMEHRSAAESYYREALRIATKISFPDGIATYTGNLSELALDREDWFEAEHLASEALRLAEAIRRQELVGISCQRLAKALVRQGKRVKAFVNAQRAVEVLSKLKSPNALDDAQMVLHECNELA